MTPYSHNNFSDKHLDALLASKVVVPRPSFADAVIRSIEDCKNDDVLDALVDEHLRHLSIPPSDKRTSRLCDNVLRSSLQRRILHWVIPAIAVAATLAIVPALILNDTSMPAEEVIAQAAFDDPELASMLCLQAAGVEALADFNHETADIVDALNDNALAWLELETLTNYEK